MSVSATKSMFGGMEHQGDGRIFKFTANALTIREIVAQRGQRQAAPVTPAAPTPAPAPTSNPFAAFAQF